MNHTQRDHLLNAMKIHEGPLLRYASKITGDGESACEIVQEVFIRMWQTKPEKFADHLNQWLFAVCRNLAIDKRRREKRMIPMSPQDIFMTATIDTQVGADRKLESKQDSEHLQIALLSLSEIERELIHLKFQNDFSYKQIAEITGLSVSNVGYKLHHALQALRQQTATSTNPPTTKSKE